jgi:hypothetical protein
MKELLSVFLRRLALSLLLAALGVGALLLARGEGDLTFALLLGFAAALVFVWNMAWRLWHLAAAPGTARRQMLWGMALRLSVLALVLLAAASVSSEVFLMAAFGFVLCYGLALAHLIVLNIGGK